MIPIAVRNIVKTFGPVRALDEVSLDIRAGELFFLLGPSGCGKTTLLRSLAGFYVPDSGRILFDGRDVTNLPPQRRNTAMVFQNYALWPHMTVETNVAFGLAVRKVPRPERRRRAAEALDMVRMGTYGRRKPNQLSGGQQQRVALARALVVRPQCLLLDEPLSNLDAKLRLDMRTEIRRLCKEFGLTAVYVTHDQKEALSIADRMAVMFDGRISQLGPPRELYMRPSSAATADFLGETNFLKATAIAGEHRRPAGARHERTEARGREGGVQSSAGRVQSSAGGVQSSAGGVQSSALPGSDRGRSDQSSGTEPPRPGAMRRFSTDIGEFEAVSDAAIDAGRSCTLSIRPEAIEVIPADTGPLPPAANRFEARVAESIFLGETLQLSLTAGTTRLRANVAERSAAPDFKKGMPVLCSVDPRDVVVLEN